MHECHKSIILFPLSRINLNLYQIITVFLKANKYIHMLDYIIILFYTHIIYNFVIVRNQDVSHIVQKVFEIVEVVNGVTNMIKDLSPSEIFGYQYILMTQIINQLKGEYFIFPIIKSFSSNLKHFHFVCLDHKIELITYFESFDRHTTILEHYSLILIIVFIIKEYIAMIVDDFMC